jgi:hypothetical protein
MTALDVAVVGLRQALEAPRRHHMWRWLVRHRLAGVRDALATDGLREGDAWLAAREGSLLRERTVLERRLNELAASVLESPDVEAVRRGMNRLLADLERHAQRMNDLVYDTVSLELGGSE